MQFTDTNLQKSQDSFQAKRVASAKSPHAPRAYLKDKFYFWLSFRLSGAGVSDRWSASHASGRLSERKAEVQRHADRFAYQGDVKM